jgi:hypothetical protein
MDVSLETKVWWEYIDDGLKELLLQSLLLVETAENWEKESSNRYKFHDYAFIVFPAAKAYEGFLKKMFLDLGFITSDDFYGKRFRVGKALNPALEQEYREREGVYDKIVKYCGGNELAEKLWQTWKECRNLIFHWFPNEKNAITLEEAKEKVNMVITTIDFAFRGCKIGHSRNEEKNKMV